MPRSLVKPPSVCILLALSRKAVRDKLHGILRYERSFGPWRLHLQDVSYNAETFYRGFTDFDGIIADISGYPQLTQQVAAVKVPTVFVDHPYPSTAMPSRSCWVNSDGEAIGRMGAEHLLDCGHTAFGFVDSDDSPNVPVPYYSEIRRNAFVERLQQSGYSCSIYTPTRKKRGAQRETVLPLQDWLCSLPKPVGIMSAWDTRGHQVISACQMCGIRVPDDVSVLAVDNDEAICQASKPTLSSVVTDNEHGGYLAAQLLDRLLKKEKFNTKQPFLYPPLYVYARRSTANKANAEPFILETLDFIEAYAGSGINVADIVNHLKISRRYLEVRFREVVGHSILEEIHRARFQRARYLLLETEFSSAEIALLCGYESPQYFYKVFKKMTGKTTSQFRQDRG